MTAIYRPTRSRFTNGVPNGAAIKPPRWGPTSPRWSPNCWRLIRCGAQGIIRLAETYGATRLNAACRRARLFGDRRYQTVKGILLKALDADSLPETPVGEKPYNIPIYAIPRPFDRLLIRPRHPRRERPDDSERFTQHSAAIAPERDVGHPGGPPAASTSRTVELRRISRAWPRADGFASTNPSVSPAPSESGKAICSKHWDMQRVSRSFTSPTAKPASSSRTCRAAMPTGRLNGGCDFTWASTC